MKYGSVVYEIVVPAYCVVSPDEFYLPRKVEQTGWPGWFECLVGPSAEIRIQEPASPHWYRAAALLREPVYPAFARFGAVPVGFLGARSVVSWSSVSGDTAMKPYLVRSWYARLAKILSFSTVKGVADGSGHMLGIYFLS